ncbi:NADPH:quinone oxidoreductase family protein [Ectothiorhodospiraceae bacterium WFHF3C12]|nr:NADPH:quinone oxidoreductase family protein [Ectothiorhodospiraceae bacterium WFHF3C12]
MKAIVCNRYGPPESLTLEDWPDPEPGAGEVMVAVHAAAANYPDNLIIQGRYQFSRDLPFVPGGELAGTVHALGPGVEGFTVGDRVIGIPGWGAFAELAPVPAAKLVRLPDSVPMDTGAGLVITYGTTHYALRERAALQTGETLLVLGAAGGAGLSAVELGRAMGARVIAAASSDEKLALCREHGAQDTVNYSHEDLREAIRALTDGRGVDVVYDPVGGDYAEPALRSMAWRGRYLVIGFTAGEIPRLPVNLTLLKGCAIVGVFYAAFQDREPERFVALMDELMGWLVEGRVRPVITERYPLEQTARALREIAERRARGKIVIQTERGRSGD